MKVNNNTSIKRELLQLLRNSGKPVSGETLSRHLEVSRVAVWKHIQKLNSLGYHIESSHSGYSISRWDDHLYPWEFDKGKENFNAFPEIDSTMNKARELAREGCPHFTTVLAEKQYNGRGRSDRNWDSENGGLYFTWSIRPELPYAFHYIYTIGAAVAVSETAKELWNMDLQAKWPNDLVFRKKKTAGLLMEMETSGDSISWLNLGVGINVNNGIYHPERTSLKEIYGSSLDRKVLLNNLEAKFRKILKERTPETIRKNWTTLSSTIGSQVKLKPQYGSIIEGKALSIDRSGALIIYDKNKKRKQALFGEIFEKTGD